MRVSILFSAILAVSLAVKDFSGFSVYRVHPNDELELTILKQIQIEYDTKVDFWRDPSNVGQAVDIMISHEMEDLIQMVDDMGAEVIIPDVQELMDTEQTQRERFGFLDTYNRYSEIETWLTENCNATNDCTLENIGQTYESRNMWVAQLGDDTQKPIIFLECGIHAREWISPAVCLNIINRMNDRSNPATERMRSNYNWHILVSANPDGYEFTHTDNRLWRKTRSENPGSACVGCDPNRNFDFNFGGAGTSGLPCSDIYRGPFAFSEIETQNIDNYVTPRASRIRAYYAVHSYGQWVLIPWSYATNTYPADYADMLAVANEGAFAINANSGLTYVTGQSADLLGATAGCSDDWAKGSCGIKFSYTLELRDTGANGFVLPESQIQPNFEEIWDAFFAMSEFMAREYPM